MSLKIKIREDLKTALKKKKELELSALRMLNAAIINKEKEKRYKITRQNFPSENLNGQGKEKIEISKEEMEKKSQLTDEEVIEVILTEIKKRKEAALLFEKGERQDLVEKEKKELEILQRYLPDQLSEEEIKKLAKEVIEKIGAKEPKDYNPPTALKGKNIYGKVMAELMPKVKGRTEGGTASKIVKELLQSSK